MRINRVRVQKFGNIEDIDLDLTRYRGSLIAIEGRNGSGKTHLVEAMLPAVLYRRLLSYGDWVQSHFHEDGGMIAVDITHKGIDYNIHLHGKRDDTPECYLSSRGTMIAGPGVRDFDEVIATIFPPQAVTLATHFAAQNAVHGFFAMEQKDRLIVFQSLLGLDEHALWTNILATRTKEYKGKLREARAQLDVYDKLHVSDEQLHKLTRSYEEMGGLIQSLHHRIQEIGQLVEKHQCRYRTVSDQERAIQSRRTHALSVAKGIAALEASIKKIATQPAVAPISDEDVVAAEVREATLRDEIEAMKAVARAIQKEITHNTERLAHLSNERTALKNMQGVDLDNPMCRACPLTRGVDRRSQAENERDIISVNQTLDQLRDTWNTNNELITNMSDDYAEVGKQLRVYRELRTHQWDKPVDIEADQLRELLASHKREMMELEKQGLDASEENEELARLGRELDGFHREERNLSEALSNTRSQAGNLLNEIRALEAKISERIALEGLVREAGRALEDAQILTEIVAVDRREHIDTALPLIQTYCNESLLPYQNGRFSILLQTLQKKKSSDDMRESFQPIIYDSLTNTTRLKASVGECAILSEALRMATLNANVVLNNAEGGTLIRDEMTAGIDIAHLDQYMSILRSGLSTGMYSEQLFVCHSPHILEQADVIIHLDNGGIAKIDD